MAPSIDEIRCTFYDSYVWPDVTAYYGPGSNTGAVGWRAYIYGSGLADTTSVTINGADAGTVTVFDDTGIMVFIPAAAGPNVGTVGWGYSPMFPPYGDYGTGGVCRVTTPEGTDAAPFVVLFPGNWNRGADTAITSTGFGRVGTNIQELSEGGAPASESTFAAELPTFYGSQLGSGSGRGPGLGLEWDYRYVQPADLSEPGYPSLYVARAGQQVLVVDAYSLRFNNSSYLDPTLTYPYPGGVYDVETEDAASNAPGQLIGDLTITVTVTQSHRGGGSYTEDPDWTGPGPDCGIAIRKAPRDLVTALALDFNPDSTDPYPVGRGSTPAGVGFDASSTTPEQLDRFVTATESVSEELLTYAALSPSVVDGFPARTVTFTIPAGGFSPDELYVVLLTPTDYEDQLYYGFANGTTDASRTFQASIDPARIDGTLRPQRWRYLYLIGATATAPLRQRQRGTGLGAAAGPPLRQRGALGDDHAPLRQRRYL